MIACNYCNIGFQSKEGLRKHKVKHHTAEYMNEIQLQVHSFEQKQKDYNLEPLLCQNCNSPLAYKQRVNKYCSHACSASFNNKLRAADPIRTYPSARTGEHITETKSCPECNVVFTAPKSKKFCSKVCSATSVSTRAFIASELRALSYRPSQRRYLMKTRGHQCEVCSITEWNDLPTPLELDHIDGNASNNIRTNLRLICPNCHAQTSTYKAKNKGNGRMARGLLSV
jgi:uncharacterized CHY-type Zn-finger protein